MQGKATVELEMEAKSWRLLADPGEKLPLGLLSAVEVLMMEVSAVRTEGPVKLRDEGSPPVAKDSDGCWGKQRWS